MLLDNNWKCVGRGQEAESFVGETQEFTGIGGIIRSQKPLRVIKRVSWDKSNPYIGNKVFSRNLTAYLIDEFFRTTGKYKSPHIPLPLGSFDYGYYYEFAEGNESFQWSSEIEGWHSFVDRFNLFGFEVNSDTSDNDGGGCGKNVIYRDNWAKSKEYWENNKLNSGWQRIDFGDMSLPFRINYFRNEIENRKEEIIESIGRKNFRIAFLSAEYSINPRTLTSLDELTGLVKEFRQEKILELSQKD